MIPDTLPPELRVLAERIGALEKCQLFFVVGMARSGTTWLQRLLDGHPKVRCRGESHFVDVLYSNLKRAFQDYNRSIKVQGGALAHLKEYGGPVDSLEYGRVDVTWLLAQAIVVMLGKWADDDTIRAIGEKTPDNVLWIGLLGEMFPGARFVHVVRDGRDAAVSGWFYNQTTVPPDRAVVESFENYIDRYLKQWNSAMQLSRTAGGRIEPRYMEVTYESLLEAPVDVLTSVLGFLDVDADDATVADCVDSASFSKLTGGRVPGEEVRRSFLRKGIAGDWRNHLDTEIRERAWRVAGRSLEALGYGRD